MSEDRQIKNASTRISKSVSSSSDLQLYVKGVPFYLHKETLAKRSAKVAALLERNNLEELRWLIRDIEADPGTFELVARFCYGYDVQFCSENIVPVICLAYYLGMNEEHSSNNLLNKAAMFLEQRVLPSWNETIKALRASEELLNQVADVGLLDVFLESLVEKAVNDPRLLGMPIKNNSGETEEDDDGDEYRPNARRRLFVLDWKSEDLSTIPLQLYEPLIRSMIAQNVPLDHIVSSICNYAKGWVFEEYSGVENVSAHKRTSRRKAIEAVERLLPHQRGMIPCSFLFESLKRSILLEANSDCQNGFEARIGKQLDEAAAKELLIPARGYAKEAEYDVELVRRILKNFYSNYDVSDISGFVKVAKLVEEFLAEVANDVGLKIETFVSLAELSVAASSGTQRYSDGIYRAIDIFLENHRHLTESERLEACKVLDCQKLSPEACEHAAQNERLPLRIVVQVLFVSQLHIRDAVAKEIKVLEEKSKKDNEEEEEEETNEDEDHEDVNVDEDEIKMEMEKMGNKVMELERECDDMKREIENRCVGHCVKKKKAKKVSLWGEVKRKFGCMTGVHECNCQVKKKKIHPK